jgi:hypothetical protein
MFITSLSPGLGLLLSTIAIDTPNLLAIALALTTPPISGDTATRFDKSNCSFISLENTGPANKLSVGMSKKPCICSACKSTVKTLSAPAVEIKLATSLAEIGVLGPGLRSCMRSQNKVKLQ